jgi:glycosyltransferase involved in cell wall biosynthesis
MTGPLVSVVTPTWGRPELLLERCIPSVMAQTYQPLEHLVVIDGHDIDLRSRRMMLGYSLILGTSRRLVECGRNHGGVGHAARAAGAFLAAGEWICYLDDDNAYLPNHVEAMVAEAQRTGAELVTTAWQTPDGDVGGWPPPGTNHTDSSSMLHRADLLTRVSAWQPADGYAADGALVDRWVAAGVRWSFLPEPTLIYHPPGDAAAYRAWLATEAARAGVPT